MKYTYPAFPCLLALPPATAMAQTTLGSTNVTFYGRIDQAVDITRFSSTATMPGQTARYLSNDISFWGLRGSEALDGQSRVYFNLESGFSADTGILDNAGLFNRGAFVGYGAEWGSIQLGNQFTPAVYVEFRSDPFARHAAGSGVALMQAPPATPSPVVSRGTFGSSTTPNAIQYISPTIHGITGKLFYSFSEKTTKPKQVGRYAAGTLEYADGPVYIGASYEDWVVAATPLAPSADGQLTQRTLALGGSYDFKVAKLFGYVMNNTLTGQPNVQGYMAGATIPINKFTIRTIHTSRITRDTEGGRSSFYAIGVDYDLSKRTTLYTAFGHTNNGASTNPSIPNRYGLWPSVKTYAPTGLPANGQDLSTLEFGIRYVF
jgi:predicted porin